MEKLTRRTLLAGSAAEVAVDVDDRHARVRVLA